MKAILPLAIATAALAGLLAGGCATEPAAAAKAQQVQPAKKAETEVVTGSRIPQKTGSGQNVSTVSGQEWSRDNKSNVMTGPNPN